MALLVEGCKVCKEQLYLLFSKLIWSQKKKKESFSNRPKQLTRTGAEERLGELVPGSDSGGRTQQASTGMRGDRQGTAVCLHAPLSPTAAAVEGQNDLGSAERAG